MNDLSHYLPQYISAYSYDFQFFSLSVWIMCSSDIDRYIIRFRRSLISMNSSRAFINSIKSAVTFSFHIGFELSCGLLFIVCSIIDLPRICFLVLTALIFLLEVVTWITLDACITSMTVWDGLLKKWSNYYLNCIYTNYLSGTIFFKHNVILTFYIY